MDTTMNFWHRIEVGECPAINWIVAIGWHLIMLPFLVAWMIDEIRAKQKKEA